jgi:hypothetical protein
MASILLKDTQTKILSIVEIWFIGKFLTLINESRLHVLSLWYRQALSATYYIYVTARYHS